MLTNEALLEAMPLTESFDAKDIILRPIQNTPLEQLVQQTVILDTDEGGTNSIDVEATAVATESLELNIDGSQHDLLMDEIVQIGANCIKNQISFAKNIVRPVLMQYISLVEQDIIELPTSGLSKYEIKTYDVPEPLEDFGLRESLDIFQDTPYDPFKFNLRLPDVDEQTLVSLLKTGSNSVDDLITRWINRIGIRAFFHVYSNVFQVKQNIDLNNRTVLDLREFFADRVYGNDYTLMIYLIANKLENNPPENTNNNLEEYNESLILLRNQAGNRLYKLIKELNSAFENGKLVKSFNVDKTVTVYPKVYNEWLENGGDNDLLLGTAFADKGYYFVKDINERSEELKSIWNKNKIIEEKQALNDKFVYVKDSLLKNFSIIVHEQENLTESDKSTIFNIFTEELELIRLDELVDICSVCLKLLTRSLYYKTDVERILSSMERTSQENTSIDPREAALISAIELATDWACSMVRPESAY